MECKFTVGQKVVCIDAKRDRSGGGGYVELVEGNIYRVREVLICDNEVCVRLQEILERAHYLYDRVIFADDLPFLARRFKPLEERKTDISIFQKMLEPNKKVLEDA